eukprot:5148376-Amphidinium_carterae.3
MLDTQITRVGMTVAAWQQIGTQAWLSMTAEARNRRAQWTASAAPSSCEQHRDLSEAETTGSGSQVIGATLFTALIPHA